MNIGKREQIVIGSIAAILLIVVLHMLIFAPSADSFKLAKNNRDSMAQQISGLSTIPPNSDILKKFETKTNEYLSKLEDGMKRLKMDEPDCFIVPRIDEVTAKPGDPPLPPYVAATPTPAVVMGMGMATPLPTPDDPRKKRHLEVLNEKLPPQLDLIMAEIGKLRNAARGRGLQLSFLGNNPRFGWNVPTQLPPSFQTSLLWDQIKNLASLKASMDNLNKTSPQYPMAFNRYVMYLNQLGINLLQSENLARFGDFVPYIQRLFLADLILQKLKASPNPVIVENAELTREKLLHYLSIDLPLDPLEGLNENRIYFLYEDLRDLNYLIEIAQQSGVKDITSVILRGFGYVREGGKVEDPGAAIVEPERLLDDQIDDKNALVAAAMANANAVDPNAPVANPNDPMAAGGMMDPMAGMGGGPSLNLQSTARQTGDLGYAVPIYVTFIAPNTSGMNYLYEVLRDNPMAELHRLVLRSTGAFNRELTVQPNAGSTDIEFAPTFLFIPKLFDTMDTVRKMIEEIRGANGATSATLPAAAGGTAPTPAPTPTPHP